jgi:hypothetical protein
VPRLETQQLAGLVDEIGPGLDRDVPEAGVESVRADEVLEGDVSLR